MKSLALCSRFLSHSPFNQPAADRNGTRASKAVLSENIIDCPSLAQPEQISHKSIMHRSS